MRTRDFTMEDRLLAAHLANGLCNHQIAQEMHYAPDTVKKNITLLGTKLGVVATRITRTQIVAEAFRKGLIQ